MENVERIDLSTVQLLCATYRAVKEAGKSLVVAGAIPNTIKDTIRDAGYTGCVEGGDASGLWTEERN